MPVKIARSTPRPSFGLPELLVAIHTPRQSCGKAGIDPDRGALLVPVNEDERLAGSDLLVRQPHPVPASKVHEHQCPGQRRRPARRSCSRTAAVYYGTGA